MLTMILRLLELVIIITNITYNREFSRAPSMEFTSIHDVPFEVRE